MADASESRLLAALAVPTACPVDQVGRELLQLAAGEGGRARRGARCRSLSTAERRSLLETPAEDANDLSVCPDCKSLDSSLVEMPSSFAVSVRVGGCRAAVSAGCTTAGH